MNFLAHCVLSFDQPEVMVGQMISDFVKGRKQYEYPETIHKGIVLHRQIDQFTDEHAVTRIAKEVFRPYYRLYSGAFIDISFDHFLATDENEFTPGSIFTFSQQVYANLNRHSSWLPVPFTAMLPYMIRDNWLAGYAKRDGIHRSFRGLVNRSAWLTDSGPAIEAFEKNYLLLKDYYSLFWPDLKKFALEKMATMGPLS